MSISEGFGEAPLNEVIPHSQKPIESSTEKYSDDLRKHLDTLDKNCFSGNKDFSNKVYNIEKLAVLMSIDKHLENIEKVLLNRK